MTETIIAKLEQLPFINGWKNAAHDKGITISAVNLLDQFGVKILADTERMDVTVSINNENVKKEIPFPVPNSYNRNAYCELLIELSNGLILKCHPMMPEQREARFYVNAKDVPEELQHIKQGDTRSGMGNRYQVRSLTLFENGQAIKLNPILNRIDEHGANDFMALSYIDQMKNLGFDGVKEQKMLDFNSGIYRTQAHVKRMDIGLFSKGNLFEISDIKREILNPSNIKAAIKQIDEYANKCQPYTNLKIKKTIITKHFNVTSTSKTKIMDLLKKHDYTLLKANKIAMNLYTFEEIK